MSAPKNSGAKLPAEDSSSDTDGTPMRKEGHLRTQQGGKSLLQNVFSILLCPLCREYMAPPITVCQDGHNICSRCRPKLFSQGSVRCPHCDRKVLETRNVALEAIARTLQYPCLYAAEGCRSRYPMSDIAQHHSQCAFRSYNCPLRRLEGCSWRGRSIPLRQHILDNHTSAVIQPEDTCWEISNSECYHTSHQVVLAPEEVFLFHKSFDIPQRKLCIAVQLACSSGAGGYRYSMMLQKNSGRQRVELSNIVHSVEEDLEHIFMSGEGMRIDFDMLMSFVKGTRTMRIYRDETPKALS